MQRPQVSRTTSSTDEPEELSGERVVLRPLAEGHAPALRVIRATPEVAAWWGALEEDFPMRDEPDVTRYAVMLGDDVVGMVQYGEEPEPDYRHASVDIFLAPQVHGSGFGTDAIRTIVRHLMKDRGHHRVTIDPATDNAAAIRCYEKAGFRRVGTMEASWRDPSGRWRDSVLMELVVPPERRT